MFQRAMTLVNVLSSTPSWYSSGPMTVRTWYVPLRSRVARLAQKRAVSNRIGAGVEDEAIVAGRLPILPDRVRHVGADAVLHQAGEDAQRPTVGIGDVVGRRLVPGVGGLPCVERAAPSQPCGLRPRPV